MNFCGSDKTYTDQPQQFDPLGHAANGSNQGATGGPEARNAIFNTFGNYLPQWLQTGNQATDLAKNASAAPAWGQLQQNAGANAAGQYLGGSQQFNDIFSQFQNAMKGSQSPATQNTVNGTYLNQTPTGLDQQSWRPNQQTLQTMQGAYLNSAPQMTTNVDPAIAAMRQSAGREAANQNAAIQSNYAKSGLGFSTGNQQAQMANRAAGTAQANETEAATRLAAQQAADAQKFQGYEAERGRQTSAAQTEDAAQRARLGLLAQNYGQERGYQNTAGNSATDAARQAAALEATSRTGNYTTERANQNNAASTLADAYNNPINYLNQSNAGNMSTLSQIAQVVQGLAGGGQIATPNSTIVRQPGIYDYGLATAGAVANA